MVGCSNSMLWHNLTFKKLCWEAADCDDTDLKEWKGSVLCGILKR